MNNSSSIWSDEEDDLPTAVAADIPSVVWVCFRTLFITLSATVTIVGNAMTLLILPRLHSIPEHNRMLFLFLSGADLAVGFLILLSIYPAVTNRWPYGDLTCQLVPNTARAFLTFGIACLILISIDRYVAISRPLHYHLIVTKNRLFVIVLVVSLAGIGPTVINMIFDSSHVVFDAGVCVCVGPSYDLSTVLAATTLVLSGLFITVFIYTRLFYITITQLKKIHIASGGNEVQQDTGRRRFTRHAKALRMCFAFTVTYVISWLPIIVNFLYTLITGEPVCVYLRFFCYWTALSGGGLDVFALAATNVKFRQNALRLLRRCRSSEIVGDASEMTEDHSNREDGN